MLLRPGLADRVYRDVFFFFLLLTPISFLVSGKHWNLTAWAHGPANDICRGLDWNIVNQSEREGEYGMLREYVFAQYASPCMCLCLDIYNIHKVYASVGFKIVWMLSSFAVPCCRIYLAE